ncbi:hypothetical protein [uncultured Allobaculum sp.]|uniref:hypothetical protein n=1 Tax=uncultured Allobaculum sp. TaxID=1187017 RepID=UPI002591BB51|nr:hypothetical protein [uncultured Allobaculum sp.]
MGMFDFLTSGAIEKMLNAMSDEEKEQILEQAHNLAQNMDMQTLARQMSDLSDMFNTESTGQPETETDSEQKNGAQSGVEEERMEENADPDSVNQSADPLEEEPAGFVSEEQEAEKEETAEEAEGEEDETEEDEEEPTIDAFFGFRPILCTAMDAQTREFLEAAMDLEIYYEDMENPDLSASVLFLAKALLSLLREGVCPYLAELGVPGFNRPDDTRLEDYTRFASDTSFDFSILNDRKQRVLAGSLMNEILHSTALCALAEALYSAQNDRIDQKTLQELKAQLEEEGLLEKLVLLENA